jgi:hypothetical protein
MDYRLKLTEKGRKAGWIYTHQGWIKNNTLATEKELQAALIAGEFIREYGRMVHVGGIMYDWVPVE